MQLTCTAWVVDYWSQTKEVGFPQRKPLARSNTNSAVSNYTLLCNLCVGNKKKFA